jgi:hypothetical protein
LENDFGCASTVETENAREMAVILSHAA